MKFKITITLACFLATIFFGAGCVAPNTERKPQYISLVQLIANPKKYAGQVVVVRGYCHSDMESSAIYLSEDDARYLVIRNAVWLGESSEAPSRQGTKYKNNCFVEVEGIVSHKIGSVGHLGLFDVKLVNIAYIARLPHATYWGK